MTSRSVFLRRRLVAASVACACACGIAISVWPTGGQAQSGAPGSAVLPMLGVADPSSTIFGSVTSGAQAGETWAFRRLPLETPEPVVDGRALQFGPVDASSAEPQLAFMRHTAADGWQIADVPRDRSGAPLRGPTPNARSARMSAAGAGVLVGQDSSRAANDQAVVLLRKPGASFVPVPRPPDDVLLAAPATPAPSTPDPTSPDPTTPDPTTPTSPDPTTPTSPDPTTPTSPDPTTPTSPDATTPSSPDPTTPTTPDAPVEPPTDQDEQLAGDRGTGRVNVAVVDSDGGATLMLAPIGRVVEDAVLIYDGARWTRENLDLSDAPAELQIDALAAASASDAWAVGSSPGKPVRLFRRDPGAPAERRWKEVALPVSVWTDAARATGAGLSELGPLGGQAQTLTPSGGRVWIDVRAKEGERQRDATLLVDPAAPLSGRMTSWCDGESRCDHRLGAAFSTTDGYRSYAWPGAGAGTRVITNALRSSGDPASNRGTWLTLEGTTFARRGGGGGNFRPSGAFASPTAGWLEGPVQVGADPVPVRLRKWPAALRSPLTAVAPQPGAPIASPQASALAVGTDGGVVRFVPGQGWSREFLLSSTGGVVRAALRGVAWPEASRAHAVGDLGAMWQWRADTGLWERDPAAPIGFEGNLMGVAFDPSDSGRGYAVGKGGLILAYGKTWEQQPLPEGFADANFTQVSFAGRQAIAVSDKGVLVNDGTTWKPDVSANGLLDSLVGSRPQMVATAGLADGGAVLGGATVVLIRDHAGSAWRFSRQPLLGLTVVSAAAVRAGDRVRAVVATVPAIQYPQPDIPFDEDPSVPTPVTPPYPLPGDGYLLRETDTGWQDEERTAFAGSGDDRPLKSDPVLALSLAADGTGWAVGGWSGAGDSAGRGTTSTSGSAKQVRTRVQTAAILRYDAGGDPGPAPGEAAAEIPMTGSVVRFAIGGHPQCAEACADLASQDIAPDRMQTGALELATQLAGRPGGPRAFLSTGGRIRPGLNASGDPAEEKRFADLLGTRLGLPIYNAVSSGDVDGQSVAAYSGAFAGSAAPFGDRSVLGTVTDSIPAGAAAPAGAARTHYAFDSAGFGGIVRVVVIDNSAGSLAESDAHQIPAEPQRPWLIRVLDDAVGRGIPSIVIGSRELNPRAVPALNVATDGDDVAGLLVDHGASAYFFDRPEENRTSAIPAGGATTIPAFGTGSLGYRSGIDDAASVGLPDALFGDGGFLLTEIDVSARNPATNRAPVKVRLIPVVESLSLNPIDGTLLRRSRPALFQGLGRRPVAGDRWGRAGGDGVPSPGGADPYTEFPSDPCLVAGCSTRIPPEFSFSSSAPDVLDMVAVDPATSNQRKPLLGADDKVISDAASGLVCPFNAGTTMVTLTAGGRSVSQPVTVLPGSVLRPCGTRPLDPSRIKTQASAPAPAPAPPPPAAAPPAVLPALVPPPPPAAPAANAPAKPAAKVKASPPAVEPPLFESFLAPSAKPGGSNSVSPPPPAPGFFAQPIPPGGATVRVTEEKRETEIATEESQAYARITADDRLPLEPFIAAMALIAALAGTTIRPGRRRGPAYARVKTLPPARRPQKYRRSLP